jgi:peptide deformylase
MALLEIKTFGCPVLREKASPVPAITDEIRTLIEDMFETMYAAEGIGLAAPQVGVSARLLILDVSPSDPEAVPTILINPEIVSKDGEITGEEGCLSLPGVAGDVKRSAEITIRALNGDGQSVEYEMSNIHARAAQHELDHLDGILVTDHFSTIKRNLVRGQLRKLKRVGIQQAPELTSSSNPAGTT